MEKVNFHETSITSEEELRELIGTPHELVANKTITILDEQCKKFISASPLLFLATSDPKGNCDVSPRGDQPGSIYVLNDHQLVIPDRPGNKRLDSILNILSNPHVGLIFLIPGFDEVLRVNGKATIIKNNDILDKMNIKGKPPLLGIGVDVEECFIHCPRALKESEIWSPDKWPKNQDIPSMIEIFRAHLKINGIDY
ncbi:MSMEG_1061 family FMN-dependent PPOX-type flavoprotein [Anaerobacillus isosaccharinicus]|uniref:Phosphohydrolase n=1 Tax=Anaerobacillus isosaccharinicus TaxID=1532552 RepID=A0A1S2L1I0_9BACI|nr:MSMEG_1061 family FMN-dependent PPOX-type flavoprotein [Anaerobacillus isosaccharinicus]MBA5588287.1 pyridoxamine 5'-phosphate oxidase family protein [Anaerobacillus isosaccharinicus]QOY38276.1 pyridoxamine 5'-phosphate oxidase family protein [Anaerobacillus isosaccharinicus]